MRHGKDDRTLDIFEVPQPRLAVPGCGNYSVQVSELVAQMLKGTGDMDRFEVAAQMSRLSGDDVSKGMLDAWSSTARTDHNLPLYRVALLEEVCASHALTNWLVNLRGGRVAYGREALDAELGRLERLRDDASRKVRALKQLMGGSDA
ncbi:hypothetical protein [Pseudomonas sp. NPDC079086]|uniref:hypothetical protein n=1 Tax=unclassified Pseudomonas TaxID=196821 RepID=UPI0037CCBE0B